MDYDNEGLPEDFNKKPTVFNASPEDKMLFCPFCRDEGYPTQRLHYTDESYLCKKCQRIMPASNPLGGTNFYIQPRRQMMMDNKRVLVPRITEQAIESFGKLKRIFKSAEDVYLNGMRE